MLNKLFGFRGLAAVLGVGVIFASVGFADSFKINDGRKIVNAEGETEVVDCGNLWVEKDDDWRDNQLPDDGLYDQPLAGGWIVDKIKVSGIESHCIGGSITVVLTNGDGENIAEKETTIVPGGSVVLDFSSQDIPAYKLRDLHILVSKPAQ